MQITIEKKGQTYSFNAEPDESILYAGLKAGVPLPYECATGTCGTCKARLKQGDIDEGWPEAPGKSGFKAERGEFLMCQSQAMSDCDVTVPSAISAFRHDDHTPDHYTGIASGWRKLTDDVSLFTVRLDHPVNYHAGQFFVLQIPGIDGFRAYSMVNHEPGDPTLEFVIKRKPDGAFSNWVFNAVRDDQELKLFGPLGRATFHEDEVHDLFMIAGGSGIAGLLSILEHASRSGYLEKQHAAVFFGIRTERDVFFTDRLARIKQRHPDNLHVTLVFSEPQTESADDLKPELQHLDYDKGWVHEVALSQLEQSAEGKMIYLAGPPPMVNGAIRSLIIEKQVPAERIRYDKFG